MEGGTNVIFEQSHYRPVLWDIEFMTNTLFVKWETFFVVRQTLHWDTKERFEVEEQQKKIFAANWCSSPRGISSWPNSQGQRHSWKSLVWLKRIFMFAQIAPPVQSVRERQGGGGLVGEDPARICCPYSPTKSL